MLSDNQKKVNTNDVNNSNPNASSQPPLEEEHFYKGRIIEFASDKDEARYLSFRKEYEQFGLVSMTGRTLVVKPTTNKEDKEERECFEFSSLKDFHEFHAPDSFGVLEDTATGKAYRHRNFSKVWHESEQLCRRYNSVVFNLDPTRDDPKQFNLWRGFIEPKAGDASRFVKHVEALLVNETGNFVESRYLIDLLAWVVQNPHLTPGVMALLIGGQGHGKSTIYETLRRFCPSNAATTSNLEGYLKWNGHTANCKFIGLEEAFSNGHYLVQQRIKDIITNVHRDIEYKGKDILKIKNVVFYVGTSNSSRPFSIDQDDRRTAVFATQKAGDWDYFDSYYNWLDNEGGAAIVLNYLLNLDIKGFKPAAIPNTKARAALKVESLSSEESFIHNLLCYEYDEQLNIKSWDHEQQIERTALFELFKSICHTRPEIRRFSAKLAKIFAFPQNWSDNWRRPRGGGNFYKLPPMEQARELYAKHLNSSVEDTFNS